MPKAKHKTVLDESALAKLLEAAYVVQEHKRELQALGLGVECQDPVGENLPDADLPGRQTQSGSAMAGNEAATSHAAPVAQDDYTLTLAQIVETQYQIQVRRLELDNALALLAQRTAEIARADGAAIGIVDGNNLRYRAAAGKITQPVGSEIPLQRSPCGECVQAGRVVRSADVSSELLSGTEECQPRGIHALIAVPIYHAGGIAGGLELYYAGKHAFAEQDVHTCQLMAGLITEALARNEELTWKKSLASERAVMLEALEKLQPELAALVDSAQGRNAGPSASGTLCRKCGHELIEREQFCGHCGSPRGGDVATPGQAQIMPANGASSQPEPSANFDENLPEKALADSISEEMPEVSAQPEFRIGKATLPQESPEALTSIPKEDLAETSSATGEEKKEDAGDEEDGQAALPRPEPAAHWSSAATARDFLEKLAATRPPTALARFWNARRGDFYLAIAVILVACVIRWGIWSNHPASSTGSPVAAAAAHHKSSSDTDLSFFDQMLIKLGLAEAPEPPEYKGNPETQVWVDLHTALYYCPGTDLYGKTPNGKFTTQRDAQLDQFEPAYRKACN